MAFITKDFIFFHAKIHEGGVAFICDDLSEKERESDLNRNKDLEDLKESLGKLNYSVVTLYNFCIDEIISLAKLLYKIQDYKSLLCIIFSHKSNDQMKIIVEAFDNCDTLNSKPKLFFNPLEEKKDDDTVSSLNCVIKFCCNVMQYFEDETFKFFYRHD